MAPKRQRNRTVSLKRVKVTVEMKRKIVELKEQGMCVKDIARTFARPSSTICTILKNRDKFMEVDASSGLTRISTKRLRILDDVEWLLLEWIRERHRLGEPIDEQAICERARTIAAELAKALPPGGGDGCAPSPFAEEEEFKASRGWFERFKQRTGMQDAATGASAGAGLLVASRHGAAVNQGPPLLPAVAATVNTTTTSSSSSSSSGSGGGADFKEDPERQKKTAQEQTTTEPPVAPPHHATVDDSADESSSSSSSSEAVEAHQRTAGDEAEQQMSSSVSDMLTAWQTVAACIERYHPNRAVAAYVTAMFNEYGVAPVRLVCERMQEQRH